MGAAFDKINKLRDEYKTTLERDGREALIELFREFFMANPKVYAVGWTQYTPYFNDGEPCEFGVNEFYVDTRPGRDYEEDSGSFWDDSSQGWRDAYSLQNSDKQLNAALKSLQRECYNNQDALLSVFGDHTKIIATPKGFQVDSYDHD